uniref:Uncharacterized protein n=1 Tax=Steinernema glaseri TaxID=37863 RepID=A0A1I7YGR4_9BILA
MGSCPSPIAKQRLQIGENKGN